VRHSKTKISWGTIAPEKIVGSVDNLHPIIFSDWFLVGYKYYRINLSRYGVIEIGNGIVQKRIARVTIIPKEGKPIWQFFGEVFRDLPPREVEKYRQKVDRFLTPERTAFIVRNRDERPNRKAKQKERKGRVNPRTLKIITS
jgi:hypothetical protein